MSKRWLEKIKTHVERTGDENFFFGLASKVEQEENAKELMELENEGKIKLDTLRFSDNKLELLVAGKYLQD